MAYALSRNAVPTIRNYSEALRHWEQAKPWRGQSGEHDMRPLGPTRKDRLKIYKGYGNEPAIHLRYHYTDCVVYFPDGSVEVTSYPSQSTNTFVRDLSPFEPDFLKADRILWVQAKYVENSAIIKTGYRIEGRSKTLRFQPVTDKPTYPLHWELHPDSARPEPFVHRVMDRKQAKLALKDTNYCDFVPWANAVRAMLKRPAKAPKPFRSTNYKLRSHQIVDLLGQGMDGWMKILDDRGSNCIAHVRDAIYRETTRPIVIETEVPCIQGYSDYESFVGNSKNLDNY